MHNTGVNFTEMLNKSVKGHLEVNENTRDESVLNMCTSGGRHCKTDSMMVHFSTSQTNMEISFQ